eukprot:scaffold571159_cov16-Prasinocladus_malaysianus.AAC.1
MRTSGNGCSKSFLNDVGVMLAKNRDKNQEAQRNPSPQSLSRTQPAKLHHHLKVMSKSQLEECVGGEIGEGSFGKVGPV